MPMHTPGPWALVIEPGSHVIVTRTRGYTLRVIDDSPRDEAYANARLIAAAPELLAKLQEIHGGMACSCRLQPLVGGPVPCPTCQIGAVIAKAEGR